MVEIERNNLIFTKIEGGYQVSGVGSLQGVPTTDDQIIIPERINGEPVIRIKECGFTCADNIEKVVIPSSVKSIGTSAFAYCYKLSELIIGENVEEIEDFSFYSCKALKTVEIPASVTKLNKYAFSSCPQLKLVVYSTNLEQSSKNPEYTLDLRNLPVNVLRGPKNRIPALLYYVENLANGIKYSQDIVSKNLKTAKLLIKELSVYALGNENVMRYLVSNKILSLARALMLSSKFTDSSDLGSKTVLLDYLQTFSQEEKDELLMGDFTMKEPTLATIKKEWGFKETADGTIELTRYKKESEYVEIPSHVLGKEVTTINAKCFKNNIDVSCIIVPNTVKEIQFSAFSGCVNLKKIILGNGLENFNSIAFWGIENPFAIVSDEARMPNSADCVVVASTLPKIELIEEYAFVKCTKLVAIDIPSSVTIIKKHAFYDCINLERISIPASLSRIESCAFSHCAKLKKTEYLSSVTDWLKIRFDEFESNPLSAKGELLIDGSPLKTLSLTSYSRIKDYAFGGCSSIEEVEINGEVFSLGLGAFWCCYNLKKAVIKGAIEMIPRLAFASCRSLEKVKIGSNVNCLGWHSFSLCDSLKKIVIPRSVLRMSDRVFENSNKLKIYCMAKAPRTTWDREWNIERAPVVWDYTPTADD